MELIAGLVVDALAIGLEQIVEYGAVEAIAGIGETITNGAVEEGLLNFGFDSVVQTPLEDTVTQFVKEGAKQSIKTVAKGTTYYASKKLKEGLKRKLEHSTENNSISKQPKTSTTENMKENA